MAMPSASARAHLRVRRSAVAIWALLSVAAVAVAAASAAADAAGVPCDAEGGACPAAAGVEDTEETALLAHRKVAREAREELHLSQQRRHRRRRSDSGCTDEPQGWKDSSGNDCKKYVKDKWCTSSQGYGSGWWTIWGSFGSYATDGVDAAEACCGCGGGTASKPSQGCHVTESANGANYGIEFYFHTDGSSDGCSPSSCTPQNFLSEGLPKVIDAVPAQQTCGCWAPMSEQGEDGSVSLPADGERLFLFSYVKEGPGTCSAQTCWQKYAQVLDVFTAGDVSPKTNSTANRKSTSAVLATEHWTAMCETMPEGSRDHRGSGLAPVSGLVNELMAWDATGQVEAILQVVSIFDETNASEASFANIAKGSMPPPTMKSVLGAFAVNWRQVAFQTAQWLLDSVSKLRLLFSGGEVQETVVLGTSFNSQNYFPQMVEFLVAGLLGKDTMKQWYLILSGGGKVANGPGPNTTSYYAWQDVKAQLEGLGAKIEAGTVVRENELGVTVLNGALWPEAPGGKQSIFLGASREAHAFVRPMLADVLDNAQGAAGSTCDGSTCWDATWLRQQARDFFANRTAFQDSDLKWYVAKVLHKVHLNLDLSDEEAQAFASYMTKAVTIITFPETQMESSITRSSLQVPEVQAERSASLEKFKPALQAKFPNVSFSEADLALAAAAFLDSLQFAGGLSVPTALSYVLALTHQKKSSKWPALQGVKLKSSNIEGILWETMRLYPPVAGFPYWEMVNGSWHHQVPNVDMAMLDETIFDDPDVFKIRPLDHRKEHSIGWVDFATYPNGFTPESNRAPHSHSCPGKELSLQIMLTFLEEFASLGPWKRLEEDIVVNAYMATPFTLNRMSDDLCWTPPPECASKFVYNFKTYHGCTKDDYSTYWCANTKLYVPFQWSVCTSTPGPCSSSAREPADAVDASQLLAINAAADCLGKGGSKKKKAKCVCDFANNATGNKERACTELSAVASEVGGPWSCTLKKKKKGKKVCRPSAPWYRKAKNFLSTTWDKITTWGQSLVPTSKCYPANPNSCGQFAMATEVTKCGQVTADTLSRDWLDMPKQLQGVFWLTTRGDTSALMSFGRTNDGAGMSPGSLGKDGTYKVRLAGDRAWSYFQTSSGTFNFAEAADLVNSFTFNSAEDPTFAKITPSAKKALGGHVPPWLVSANMTLVTGGSSAYPGSVVWQHKGDVLRGAASEFFDYQIVQVIDGDGKRLPAFKDFVDLCNDPATSGTLKRGKIWYRAYLREPFDTFTVQEELRRCPAAIGIAVPGIATKALFLTKQIPHFSIHDFVGEPPIDEWVYDDFTFVTTLGSIHSQLMAYGGRYKAPEDRVCLPHVTRPLEKVKEFGSLSSLEETDAIEGECVPQPSYRVDIIMLCATLVLSRLPWLDAMESDSNNTWAKALAGYPGLTKEDLLMGYFDPYKNQDGDPIYPPVEFDWWSTYRTSNYNWEDAFESAFTLDMLGSHLVQEVAGAPPSRGGATAALVVKLDVFSGLSTRPGFSPWGSNMYFTAEGAPLCVERNTLSGTPEFVWADAPAEEWQYAKFVFRSTMMNAVTAVDHLWFAHMSVSNPLAIATREVLQIDHPLRRLLTAVTFGSIDVDAEAQQLLLGRDQVLHRASPYADWAQVHGAAEDLIKTLEGYFEVFLNPAAHAKLHPRMQKAPFYADGPLLMTAISDMIEGYFGAMGDSWCDADTDAIMDQNLQDFAAWFEDWFRNEREDRAKANLKWLKDGKNQAPWTCGAVKKLLKCFMFTVSGFHQHVGKVADYVRDPAFVGVSWAPGEMESRPRQALLYAVVSAATGYIGVPINQDFRFMLKGVENAKPLKQVLSKFQDDLNAIIPTIEKRNQDRKVPYQRMNPSFAEISLYQ